MRKQSLFLSAALLALSIAFVSCNGGDDHGRTPSSGGNNGPQPISVTGVSLNKSNTTITVGQTETLVPTIHPSNATNQNVAWSSSDPGKATVSSNGVVTGVTQGTARITVTTVDGSHKDFCDVSVAQPVEATFQFVTIATGRFSSLAIGSDGSLWGWGLNDYGQIGDSTTTKRLVPTRIGTATDWAHISCGSGHTIALKKDSSLWGWGLNDYGQLGDGTHINRLVPTRIGPENDWLSISCGMDHTVAIKKDGSLWTWGYDRLGQLGGAHAGLGSDWVAISAGIAHTIALKKDGSLWGCGRNDQGQVGIGSLVDWTSSFCRIGTANDWASISCGGNSTLAIKKDGSLWAWGSNQRGILGNGQFGNNRLKSVTPVQIGTASVWAKISLGDTHAVALAKDGSLWAWGTDIIGDGAYYSIFANPPTACPTPVLIGTANDWAEIFAGYGNTFALKVDGSLWAWGSNHYGQLGDGTTTDRLVPARVDTSGK